MAIELPENVQEMNTSNHNASRKRGVKKKSGRKTLNYAFLSLAKSLISASQRTIDGSRLHFPILLLHTPTHQHNILRQKNVDIQRKLPCILPVKKQYLIKIKSN